MSGYKMSNKRFVLKNAYPFDRGEYIFDSNQDKFFIEIDDVIDLLNEQQSIIDEQKIAIDEMIIDYQLLRTQLLICQQPKSDDGQIQVWEIPPLPKGKRITFTTSDGEKDE